MSLLYAPYSFIMAFYGPGTFLDLLEYGDGVKVGYRSVSINVQVNDDSESEDCFNALDYLGDGSKQ